MPSDCSSSKLASKLLCAWMIAHEATSIVQFQLVLERPGHSFTMDRQQPLGRKYFTTSLQLFPGTHLHISLFSFPTLSSHSGDTSDVTTVIKHFTYKLINYMETCEIGSSSRLQSRSDVSSSP